MHWLQQSFFEALNPSEITNKTAVVQIGGATREACHFLKH
jgi:hypothetical protein